MPTVILRDKHAHHEFEIPDDDDGEVLSPGLVTGARITSAMLWQAKQARERAAEERLIAATDPRDRRVLPVAKFLCKANADTWEPEHRDHWICQARAAISVADAAGRKP